MGLSKEVPDVVDIIRRKRQPARLIYLSQNYSLEKPGESELIADASLDPLFLKFDSEKAPTPYTYEIRDTASKFIGDFPVE